MAWTAFGIQYCLPLQLHLHVFHLTTLALSAFASGRASDLPSVLLPQGLCTQHLSVKSACIQTSGFVLLVQVRGFYLTLPLKFLPAGPPFILYFFTLYDFFRTIR